MGNVINVQMDEDFYNQIIQGGGSGNGETSNWRYFDLSKIMSVGGQILLATRAFLIKYYDNNKNKLFIAPAGMFVGNDSHFIFSDISVAVDFNSTASFVYNSVEYQTVTIQELFNDFLISESDIIVGEITKEEFYSLE